MIEKYISELLETNNRVIVPDFGAFMVKLDAGKRAITFNDFLKYNDGLLVNHVASKEKISKDDAFKKIREFAKELQTALKTSQKFPMASFGTLVKDERGGIRFITEEETTIQAEQSKPSEQITEVATQSKKETDSKPQAEQPKKQEESEKSVDNTQQKPPIAPPIAATTTNAPSKSGTTTPPHIKPIVKPGTPPPPHSKSNISVSKKPAKKSNATTIIVIIGVVVVLGVAGGLFYMNYDEWIGKPEQKESAIVDEKRLEEEKEEQRIKDSIQSAEAAKEEAAKEEAAKKQTVTNQKKYYLVAGSFKIEKNAQKFSNKLKNQGYNSEVFMESQGFWRVSFNSFIDRKEAFAEYQKLRDRDIQVWVIRH